MTLAPLFLVIAVGVVSAAAARERPSDGPPDLVEKAYGAAEERRYCEAVPLFLALHERAPQPRHLYRAAEVAYAGGDLAWALDLYRSVKEAYPRFDKSARVAQRLAELEKRIKKGDVGTPCAPPATVCGDWLIRPGEQCDDGNVEDGDGCDGNCTLSTCGNGRRSGSEACDDGNTADGDGCSADCTELVTAPRCGNARVEPPELCDDGNTVSGDGCDATCTPTGCGNGVVTADEQCDDGNAVSGDGCARDCTVARCGDGVLQDGEQCDDGNSVSGDGCDASCMAPPASPARGALLPMVLGVSGAGVAALSLGAVGLGLAPYVEGVQARDAIARGDAGADEAQLRVQAADAEARFSAAGVPLVVIGASGAVIGAALVGVGVWRGLARTDEDATEAADATASTPPAR